jgi:Polyketide cyclase / dehydrase and lipid transport
MDMHRGMGYAMVSTVTEFDEGRRIAWSPKPANGRGARFVGRIWRYELEPVDGGTLVRETWDISREAGRFLMRYAMASRTRRDMAKSLEQLDQLVTASS